MTTTFKTKEQYFAFRDAWKSAVNNTKAKSHLEPADEWFNATNTYSTGTGIRRVKGWIHAQHAILFNILCNKPIDNGFTPVTNANKLQQGMYINHGFYLGILYITNAHRIAKKIIAGDTIHDQPAARLTDFLEPFNGTVSLEMLASLELPTVHPLFSNYGKSKQVANEIIAGNFKPINFQQVYAAIEQVA